MRGGGNRTDDSFTFCGADPTEGGVLRQMGIVEVGAKYVELFGHIGQMEGKQSLAK